MLYFLFVFLFPALVICGKVRETTKMRNSVNTNHSSVWESISTSPTDDYWTDIVSSKSGKYWARSGIFTGVFVSSDYGNSWLQTLFYKDLIYSMACIASGQTMYAGIGGGLFVSNDAGLTWVKKLLNPSFPAAKVFGISCSESGQYLTASFHGYSHPIMTSNDYGVNWYSSYDYSLNYARTVQSGNGQYAIIIDDSLWCFVSSNFGSSFEKRFLSFSSYETSINSAAISTTGQYMYVSSASSVYKSFDFGRTFVKATTNSLTYKAIATDSTGQLVAVASYKGKVFISLDFGVSWAASENSIPCDSYRMSMSSDGSLLFITGYNDKLVIKGTNIFPFTTTAIDPPTIMPAAAPTVSAIWTPIAALTNVEVWRALKCSDDLHFCTVSGFSTGDIYTSSTYGVSWARTFKGTSVKASGDLTSINSGEVFIVNSNVDGNFLLSLDYGQNWTYVSFGVQGSIAVSVDTKYLIAVAKNQPIYVSKDFAATWYANTATKYLYNVAMSSTGQYAMAVGGALPGFDCSYTINYGETWQTCVQTFFHPTLIVMSNSGEYTYALGDDGSIGRSVPFRNAFAVSNAPILAWSDIDCSTNGQFVAATVYNGRVYVSNDFGVNWSPVYSSPVATSFFHVQIDETGNKLVVVSYTDKVAYVTHNLFDGITSSPTMSPTSVPSIENTFLPSISHTDTLPSTSPTALTRAPTDVSTTAPSIKQTTSVSASPSDHSTIPSTVPSNVPSALLSSSIPPSAGPTKAPTTTPNTGIPTAARKPSIRPSVTPSKQSSIVPSTTPTTVTTRAPTSDTTSAPQINTVAPTTVPTSLQLTDAPSSAAQTTLSPTIVPSVQPTVAVNTVTPSFRPTMSPTSVASTKAPTTAPTAAYTLLSCQIGLSMSNMGTDTLSESAEAVLVVTIATTLSLNISNVQYLNMQASSMNSAHFNVMGNSFIAHFKISTDTRQLPAYTTQPELLFSNFQNTLQASVNSGNFTTLLKMNGATTNVNAFANASVDSFEMSQTTVTPSTDETTSDPSGGASGFSTGAIIGVAVGGGCVLLVVLFALRYGCCNTGTGTPEAIGGTPTNATAIPTTSSEIEFTAVSVTDVDVVVVTDDASENI